MRARVKDDCKYPSIRSAGLIWIKKTWIDVPKEIEREIKANPFLETEAEAKVEIENPVRVDDKAEKMIVKRGRTSEVRKL